MQQPKAIAQLLEQPVHFAFMSVYSDLCSSLHIRVCYCATLSRTKSQVLQHF